MLRLVHAWRLFCAALLVLACTVAAGGELGRGELDRRFRPPLHVGEKLREIPAWPITSELEPDAGPVGYVFESIDLAPIPGFEGSPFNLLIAIDRKGTFMDVEVLRQHEPVFLGGLGEAPLHLFVRQYAGKRLQQEIAIASPYGGARNSSANRVVLDGVTKATASIRIVNQTVLASALAVARARLKFGEAPSARVAATPRADLFERHDVADLLRIGAIAHLRLSNREVERLFAGSEGEGADAVALAHPDDPYIDLYVAYLNVPSIGRALLGEREHAALMQRLDAGQHAYWIGSRGRQAIVDGQFVPGTVPPQLSLIQGGLPLELRDSGSDPPPAALPVDVARIFVVERHAGLDPAARVELQLSIARSRGTVLLRTSTQTAVLPYALPERYFAYPPQPRPEWLKSWLDRWPDLAAIGIALALLVLLLLRPRWLGVTPSRLAAVRNAYLLFTLFFLGGYAQGQLSIVQLTGAIKAVSAGQGLGGFLYDPVSLLLMVFTLISLAVWGRGVYCGWLCPYGALQEFIALAARRLGVRPRRLPGGLDRGLRWSRVPVLATLLLLAALAPDWAARAVELEPFKTVITVGFERSAGYVGYALLTLLAGAIYVKAFCRYLCPLGTALSLGGKLRFRRRAKRRAHCDPACPNCRDADQPLARCHRATLR